MKKQYLFLILFFLISALITVGCSQSTPSTSAKPAAPAAPASTQAAAPAPAKVIELRLASQSPPTHFTSKVFTEWVKKVKEQTNGQVNITPFFSATLGPTAQYWDMLKTRSIDIAWILPFYITGAFPMSAAFDQPLFVPYDKADATVLNTLFSKYIAKEWSDAKVLWPGWMTPLNLHMVKTPVNKLEDLKGRQVRCPPGPAYVSILKALGAAPVEIVTAEVYSALQKGMAEGYLIGIEAVISQKLDEVSKYHILAAFNIGMNMTAMSLQTWNSLPPDAQKVINDLSPWAQEEMIKLAKTDVQDAITKLQAAGHTVISLPPDEAARWRQATKPIVDNWVSSMDAKGLPASALLGDTLKAFVGP
jgi:TRAP-type C4-dicarboxylate transport system substrate-binding protein